MWTHLTFSSSFTTKCAYRARHDLRANPNPDVVADLAHYAVIRKRRER